jgi:predicted ATPase
VIQRFAIKGFKRFREREFDLAALTVLAGLNGVGKTSFIHGLVLLREASVGGTGSVRLNGPSGLELGTAEDVRNWEVDTDIAFDLHHGTDQVAAWRFAVPPNEALYLSVAAFPDARPLAFTSVARAFTYLCAERLGPRSVHSASPLPADALEVGTQGEYCAQVLATLGDRPLADEERLHPERDPNAAALLKYELEHCLREIVTAVEIEAEPYRGTSVIGLRFRAPGGEWVRAPNMGFGVSYALPVVLGGLIASKAGLLIVENPEAHLHPAGQSRMGVFLAWLASRGVQVVVETHSDHVLNGIRRAIGEYRYLQPEQAIVHFFDADDDGASRVTRLGFNATGGVTDWPRSFFDQYQVDIAALGRIRRQR